MRVLVTGASGLLGRAVVPMLRERGHEVEPLGTLGVDPDDGAYRLFVDLRVGPSRLDAGGYFLHQVKRADAVVHLAGRRAGVAEQHRLGADLLLDNLAIDLNVFRAMRAHGVKRGVYASTVSLYRDSEHEGSEFTALDTHIARYGFPEICGGNTLPDDSVRYSALGKLTAERAIEAMNFQDSSAISVVRLVNTYGPHDNFGPDALVIPALIKRALSGENPLWVQGAQNERDFLYVDDAARGIVAALEAQNASTWNLGTGTGVRIGDIARLVLQACGRSGDNVLEVADGVTGATRKVVDASKARHELGWAPQVSLEQGIRYTVEWFKTSGATALQRDR